MAQFKPFTIRQANWNLAPPEYIESLFGLHLNGLYLIACRYR